MSWGSTEVGPSSGDLEVELAATEGPCRSAIPCRASRSSRSTTTIGRDPDEPGRLWVRSRNLAVSGDRLTTRFRRLGLDDIDRPWFDTGDEGWIATDGRIVVQGRVDGDLKANGLRSTACRSRIACRP